MTQKQCGKCKNYFDVESDLDVKGLESARCPYCDIKVEPEKPKVVK